MSLAFIILGAIAGLALLLVVVWLLVLAYVRVTSPGKGIERFFEIGDDDLTPAERIKISSNHPGAGGNG